MDEKTRRTTPPVVGSGEPIPAATEETAEPEGQFPTRAEPDPDEHQGGTEEDIGDTTGPGAGYDEEPEQEKDSGGVAPS